METNAIGWPLWLITFWYLWIWRNHVNSKCMYMYNCSKIHRYQYVVNQGGHPIALDSMVTKLCEKSLLNSVRWCCRGRAKREKAKFCRSVVLLSFRKPLWLCWFVKKLNSLGKVSYSTLVSPRWPPLRMRTIVVSFFIFCQNLSTKKIKELRPKMTKLAWRGSCLNLPLRHSSWNFRSVDLPG